jgi:hypothetical protein
VFELPLPKLLVALRDLLQDGVRHVALDPVQQEGGLWKCKHALIQRFLDFYERNDPA